MEVEDIQFRDFRLKASETESKTVEATLSSDKPYERYFGYEILSHDSDAVGLERAEVDGIPLIFNHNTDCFVGMARNFKIKGGKLHATLHFGNSAKARELLADVNDGLLKNISIGYQINEMKQTGERDDKPVYTVTDWTVLEVSIAPVPADISIGIGRSHSTPAKANFGSTLTLKRGIQKMDTDIVLEERQRISDITVIGGKMGNVALARQFVDNGGSVEQFREALIKEMPEQIPTPACSSDIGLTRRESERFSFVRAIHAMAQPTDRKAQEAAGFERACSEAVAQNRGTSTEGYLVPDEPSVFGFQVRGNPGQMIPRFSVPSDVLKRDLSAGTATDGAELVATNLLHGSFIDVLRNALVVANAGATFLTDLNGDVAIPRKTSGSNAAWIATEGGDASQSDPQFDQVTLTPKTAGVYTEYTRQLRLQSSLDIEQLVRADLAMGLASLIDLAALYGNGTSGAPTGVVNTTGINDPAAWAAAVPTFAEVVNLETLIDTDNALLGSPAYITNAAMRGSLKTTEKSSGTAQFVYEKDNTMNGYPALITNSVTSGDLLYGNWADLLIGLWGSLDLLVNPYTHSLSGTIQVVAHQSVDVAVRNPVSFALGNDTV